MLPGKSHREGATVLPELWTRKWLSLLQLIWKNSKLLTVRSVFLCLCSPSSGSVPAPSSTLWSCPEHTCTPRFSHWTCIQLPWSLSPCPCVPDSSHALDASCWCPTIPEARTGHGGCCVCGWPCTKGDLGRRSPPAETVLQWFFFINSAPPREWLHFLNCSLINFIWWLFANLSPWSITQQPCGVRSA